MGTPRFGSDRLGDRGGRGAAPKIQIFKRSPGLGVQGGSVLAGGGDR